MPERNGHGSFDSPLSVMRGLSLGFFIFVSFVTLISVETIHEIGKKYNTQAAIKQQSSKSDSFELVSSNQLDREEHPEAEIQIYQKITYLYWAMQRA